MPKRRREAQRRRAGSNAAARQRSGSARASRVVNDGRGARWRLAAVIATVAGAIGVAAFIVAGGFASPAASPGASLGGDAATTAAPTATTSVVGSHEPTPTIGGTAPAISGVECDVDEGTAFHVHAHLNIRIDGRLFLPPADVGILPVCLYWLHTHQGQGVIHVEAPAELVFTLGQFFDVWGETLSSTQVLHAAIGPDRSLFMFIDGQPYAGDPRAIELRNLESIELQVGRDPLDPLPYTFPPDLL